MAAPAPASRNYLWPVAIAVVLVLGVVAVLAARGSSKDQAEEVAGQQVGEVIVDGSGLPTFTGQDGDAAVGTVIPALRGTGFDGEAVAIEPDGAKVIMVVAHWCPHCQREVPRVMDHLESNPLPEDVELVILSTAVQRNGPNYPPSSWLAEEGWTGRTLTDSAQGTGAAALGLDGFPYFVVTDAEGQVVVRTSGEISTDTFDQLVEAARTGSV